MKDFTEFVEKYKEVPYEDISYSNLCIFYAKDFDLWFDKDKFDWEYSHYLCKYCPDHFDKWFDKDKFDLTCYYSLFKYCSRYLTDELIWECREKIQWKEINKRYIRKSLKMKLKIAGYI